MASPTGSLSLFSAVNLVVASMIGAAVYTTSGYTLADLGTPSAVIAAWAVAGVIALCGAISYGALAAKFTESGGEYLFLSRAVHPVVGYVAGFVSIIAGFAGATAIAARGFEGYLASGMWTHSLPDGTVATGLILIGAILHGINVRAGAPVQDMVVVVKFGLLVLFFIVAAASYSSGWKGTAVTPPVEFRWSAFAVSLMWISLSYSGFNAAIYMAAEVRDAEVNVPRSLWIGTLLVTVIYVLLNVVFVYAPAPAEVVGQQEIAAIAARAIGGTGFESLVRAVILVSLATSVSALMMSGPRVYAKMAEDGVLPAAFGFQRGTPKIAIALQAALAIVVVQSAQIRELLGYLGFTLSVSAALTVATIFWLRYRGEPIDVVAYPWPPLIFVVATLLIAGIAGYQRPREGLAGLATLGFGVLIYLSGWQRRRA